MAAVPPKKMLETILKTGTLSAQEREAMESMWDAIHRYGSLSRKQSAWVEELYYKIDQKAVAKNPAVRSKKTGFINDQTVKRVHKVGSMAQFEATCPHIIKGTKQYQKVSIFFRTGGEVLEIRPEVKK
jgi:hypothetical protein